METDNDNDILYYLNPFTCNRPISFLKITETFKLSVLTKGQHRKRLWLRWTALTKQGFKTVGSCSQFIGVDS